MSQAAGAPELQLSSPDLAVPGRGHNRRRLTGTAVIERPPPREAGGQTPQAETGPGDRGALHASSSSAASRRWILTSPGWPAVRETFFSWTVFKDSFPDVLERLLARREDLRHRRDRGPRPRARDRPDPDQRRPGAVPAAPARRPSTSTSSAASRRSCSSTWSASGSRRCELTGLPTDPIVLGGIALTLSYGAYVAEVYRAGIALGPPRPARRGAGGRADRGAGAAPRDPAAGGAPGRRRRSSTTSSPCRRTSRWSRSSASPEAFRIAQIIQGRDLQLHAADRRGAALPRGHGPAGAARRPHGRAGGGGAMSAGRRCSRSAASPRPSASARSCAASTSRSREHEAIALIGASGSGKSTLLRCIDLLEEIDDGDIFLDGEVITDPSVDPVAGPPPARRSSSRPTTCSPT